APELHRVEAADVSQNPQFGFRDLPDPPIDFLARPLPRRLLRVLGGIRRPKRPISPGMIGDCRGRGLRHGSVPSGARVTRRLARPQVRPGEQAPEALPEVLRLEANRPRSYPVRS